MLKYNFQYDTKLETLECNPSPVRLLPCQCDLGHDFAEKMALRLPGLLHM